MFKYVMYSLLIIKMYLIIKTIVRRQSYQPAAPVLIKPGLGDVFDENTGTFHILNRRNISWVLAPKDDCEDVKLLVMISSGPRNTELRQNWRERVKKMEGVKIIFMVSTPIASDEQNNDVDVVQKKLEGENEHHGDILQSSLEDGHRKLGYKILTGYVWGYQHCSDSILVGKTDDNVVLDMESLLTGVRMLESNPPSVRSVMCGSGTPHRNMKPLRSDRTHMTGNWSISKEQVESDFHPDFCCGFLYLTTPSVGAELVQAGLSAYGNVEVEQIEDSFITGELRERLDNVMISSLSSMSSSSPTSFLWSSILSHCPWLSLTKLSFGNDLVVTKFSSRSKVMYVGPITNPHLWRYYICLHIEFVLENLEKMIPGYAPQFIFDLCKR